MGVHYATRTEDTILHNDNKGRRTGYHVCHMYILGGYMVSVKEMKLSSYNPTNKQV